MAAVRSHPLKGTGFQGEEKKENTSKGENLSLRKRSLVSAEGVNRAALLASLFPDKLNFPPLVLCLHTEKEGDSPAIRCLLEVKPNSVRISTEFGPDALFS